MRYADIHESWILNGQQGCMEDEWTEEDAAWREWCVPRQRECFKPVQTVSRTLMGQSWTLKSSWGKLRRTLKDVARLELSPLHRDQPRNRRLKHSDFHFKFEVIVMGLDEESWRLDELMRVSTVRLKERKAPCRNHRQDFFVWTDGGGKMGRVWGLCQGF